MEQILALDREWLISINSFHTSWLDPVMFWITMTEVWTPLFIFLLFLILRNYGTKSWVVLVGVALTIFATDQITSSLMKPYFARLRPSQEPSLEGIIHLVNGYRGGMYGFASSHAANTFGTAMFLWLLFRRQYRWVVLLFLWAGIMTYSRIYLGVHYPGDILAGALVGLVAGTAGFKLTQFLDRKFGNKTSPPT